MNQTAALNTMQPIKIL